MGYDCEKIGKRIYEARNQAGMKQETLSKKAGISQATMSNIENGVFNLRLKTLYKIAEALNVSVTWILGEDTFKELGLTDTELLEMKKYAEFIISKRK